MGKGGGLPLKSLYSLVWPNALGILGRGVYKGPVDITLMYLYSGILTLLGAVSLVMRRKLGPAANLRIDLRRLRALHAW